MTGSVFKRTLTSGRAVWCLQLDLPPGADGKRQRVFRSGFKRKSEADEALQRLLAERNAGALVKPDPRTFASFLADWFSQHAERQCSPKTIERYRQLAEYVLPHLGHLPLSEITPLIVERLLNHLKDAGGRHRKTGEARSLSARTVRHIAGLLSVAFRTAVRWKLLRQSPMESVQLPRLERVEKAALDAEQLTWYLDTCRAKVPWLYPILLFAAATGCRRGEVLALRWQDLDLGRRVARIARSLEQTASGLRIKDTKTGRARLVPLPPSVVSVLESVRAEQAENRAFFESDYRAELDLVFCAPNGDYLRPDSITAKACLVARQAGLKGVGLHSLRHTHGSQLLSAGVPLPTVSKRLGHASPWVTATIYSHALASDEIAAAEVWDHKVGSRLQPAQPQKFS